MSGLWKGVKKVFKKVAKGIKKVFKSKLFKAVLIGTAVAFTAGLATVGFSGFASSVAQNGILSTLGNTTLAGVQATLGGGLSESTASVFGANAGTTLTNGALSTSVRGLFGGGSQVAQSAPVVNTAGNVATQQAGSSLLGAVGSAIRSPYTTLMVGNYLSARAKQKAAEDAWNNMTYFGISNGGENNFNSLLGTINSGLDSALGLDQNNPVVPAFGGYGYDG